ncbi:hypothetical protein CI105_07455 [Candidatus Izimaplasma bacterium ZiA1]|uniref:DUF1576 domain-containing protein n=1 Tax=Candidatus Izimoplasma sp. ZiA1 TaxID=2024899 RepID=UPI000BAA762B|nr:hypothetical protein CI105_07455 [Candidatus Izimaplasma bacterium ZiA1]
MKKKLRKNMLIPYIGSGLILLAFILDSPVNIFNGYKVILLSQSILLTDYLLIAGIGATLLNSGLLILVSYLIIKKLDLRVTGPLFAGILTIGGFAFFGKNPLNVATVWLGIILYTRYKKISLRSVTLTFLFSSGIASVVSYIMFGLNIELFYSIPLGLLAGIISGFILVELSPHVIKFHNGYDLYNVGFASGILVLIYYSIFKAFGLSTNITLNVSSEYSYTMFIIVTVLCLVLIISGYIMNGFNIDNYFDRILSKSGRAISDFTRKHSEGITLFNTGLTGLLVTLIVFFLGIDFSGPVVGALFTVIGFSAFGKHIRNVFPSLFGVYLASLIINADITVVNIALAFIFASTLAPLTGEYGIIVGIVAGMLHLPLSLNMNELLGGLLLYSNGFSAAFVAVVMQVIITSLERDGRLWHFTKQRKM